MGASPADRARGAAVTRRLPLGAAPATWHEQAACRGHVTDAWHPDDTRNDTRWQHLTRTVCLPCPVRAHCGLDMLARPRLHRYGVAGGILWRGDSARGPLDPHSLLPDLEVLDAHRDGLL